MCNLHDFDSVKLMLVDGTFRGLVSIDVSVRLEQNADLGRESLLDWISLTTLDAVVE